MRPDNQNNSNGGKNSRRNMMAILSIILWALVITFFVNYVTSSMQRANSEEVWYSEFLEMVEAGVVERVEMTNTKFTIYLKEGAVWPLPGEEPAETGDAPAASPSPTPAAGTESLPDLQGMTLYEMLGLASDEELPTLPPQSRSPNTHSYYCAPISNPDFIPLMQEHGVIFGVKYVAEASPIVSFLISWILPVLVMVILFSILFRGMGSRMGGGLGGVGKANAKVYVEKKTGVTFKDVAGQDEAKESLVEIIDFLHNPQKYTEIGAKLPKGALLVGPPGTGKTLLAKAIAGEAGVPFFSISGSDFVEMFVGVGASRVRDLFKEASKMAPCIIFIDEIDTIGKSRDNRMGGNDEREQTLNQLLAEMDGFDPTKGVILLAATNRPEVLDQALLRPGRFDRRIIVDRPNYAGRLATLEVHTRNIRLAEDVDLKKIAIATAGTVGADLANLVNEAALRAVRHGRKAVNQKDLLAAFELVIAGSEKKGSVLTEFEKKLVAYHEVGHAMVAYKQKNSEPVQKITIVPHTQGALGYTLLMPEEDKTELRTRDELLAKIAVSMGGRAAEEVVLNTMTNGAAQDIQDATGVARSMVALYGMSDKFGMMALASRRNQYLEGGFGMDCAQNTAADVDAAVREILSHCYNQAIQVIRDNREDMDKVVEYLLEKETITGAEMVAIIEGRDPATAESEIYTREPESRRADTPPAVPAEPIPLGGDTAPAGPEDAPQDGASGTEKAGPETPGGGEDE